MTIMGEIMNACKFMFSIIITPLLILNLPTLIPNINASIAPVPDQFIAEIFPNSTLPLQLSHTNTIISFNATDFSNKIDINFDANYTIFNPENTTSIPIILPFSLAKNVNDFIFEVHVNNTQILFDLLSVSPWNENITEIDVHLAWFIERYPIILIRNNVTLLKNSTSVIRYHFSGSMSNPLDSRDLFYIVHHLGTSQEWIGNTTGRVELRVYGKQPIYGRSGFNWAPCQLVDIIGGKSYICEWNNTKSPWMDIGIRFYREVSPFEKIIEILMFNLLIFLPIAGVIIIAVIIKKKKKIERVDSIPPFPTHP